MEAIDPMLLKFVILCLVALIIGLILKYYKQPSVIAYIITGVIIGPYGFKVISDTELISELGEFGVVLLLFFVGMEISLKDLVAKWRIAIMGTTAQIILSLGFVAILGHFVGWDTGTIVLMGFVIALSSTAVIFKILEAKKEMKSKLGQDIISILIVQDLAVIPMLIIISSLSGKNVGLGIITLQIIGFILSIIFVYWLVKKGTVSLPLGDKIRNDPELQVLASFIICFGISLITGLFYISAALGAFLAGILLSSAKETKWVHHNLISFKVLFLALFFVSIGMMIDINFLFDNLIIVLAILFLIFFINTIINAVVFRINGESWHNSFYGGSILSQIGEFSFILVAIGIQTLLIDEYTYQLTIIVIALSLLISPFWISFFSRFIKESSQFVRVGNKFVKKGRKFVINNSIIVKEGKKIIKSSKSIIIDGKKVITKRRCKISLDKNQLVRDGRDLLKHGSNIIKHGRKIVKKGSKHIIKKSIILKNGKKFVRLINGKES